MNDIEEIWKDIEGYEGEYQISNCGRYRSLDRIVTYSNGINVRYEGKILSSFEKKNGYLQATLNRKSGNKKFYIHRLVASAFIINDDPINKTIINHVDENKQNNNFNNLEWCTHAYNLTYNNVHLKKIKTIDYIELNKKFKKPIIAKNINSGEELYFNSATDAAREYGFFRQSIVKVLKGVTKTHMGHTFKYQ